MTQLYSRLFLEDISFLIASFHRFIVNFLILNILIKVMDLRTSATHSYPPHVKVVNSPGPCPDDVTKDYIACEAIGHRTLLIFPLAAMLTFCQIIRKLDLRLSNFNTVTAVMPMIC